MSGLFTNFLVRANRGKPHGGLPKTSLYSKAKKIQNEIDDERGYRVESKIVGMESVEPIDNYKYFNRDGTEFGSEQVGIDYFKKRSLSHLLGQGGRLAIENQVLIIHGLP